MAIVAPYFSARARERRAALRARRAEHPGAQVELVLPYPPPVPEPGHFLQPSVVVADGTGVSILALDGAQRLWSAPWSGLAKLEAVLLDATTPVLPLGDARYYGVHGSGTFGLSIAQLRRMAARLEAKRPG